MKQRIRHPGVTLSEVLVVVAAMVLLTVLAVPATRKIVASFESASGVRRVIAAALANARAIAAKEQCYAGVRFQQDLNGDQYMIFIIHDPDDPAHTVDGIGKVWQTASSRRARKPIRLLNRRRHGLHSADVLPTRVSDPGKPTLPNLIAECSTFHRLQPHRDWFCMKCVVGTVGLPKQSGRAQYYAFSPATPCLCRMTTDPFTARSARNEPQLLRHI